MNTAQPLQATAEALTRLIPLARSPHLFLSVYLSTPRSEFTAKGARLRIVGMLESVANNLADTTWAKAFQEERKALTGYVQTLRPGGHGLALLSSQEAGEWHALWLPGPVQDHARFGRGAYVLPLLDVADEWEPVVLAVLAKDRARLRVFAAGRVEEVKDRESEVPGQHKAGGGYAAGYHRGDATQEAGGGASARFQRHILVHVTDHLKQVAKDVEDLYERYRFRRLFLAGPPETLALFKPLISRKLRDTLADEIAVDPHATEGEVQTQVLQAAQQAERRGEEALVQELITRAHKDQGAVLGLEPTLWALNRHQMHLLVMTSENDLPGRICLACQLPWPPESVTCPQCAQKTIPVDLREELPILALGRDVALEIAHGEAASLLQPYGGIGGLLKPPSPH